MTAGLLEGQRYLHSLGITGWQDAIVGAYADMTDTGARPTCRRCSTGTLTARVVGALWWHAQIAMAGAGRRRWSRGARRSPAGPVPADRGQDHAGRRRGELHGRRCSTPYLDACGHATDNSGLSMRRPARCCTRPSPTLDAAGLPGARARDRRPGRARGAGRVRGGSAANGPRRPAAPHRAHPGGPPRRRPALRRARRRRQHAAAVGRARAADGRAHDPVPGPGAEHLAVPVRRAAAAPAPARRGQRLAGVEPESACGACTSRSTASLPAEDDRRRAEPFLPEQAARPCATRWRRTPSGSA